MSTPRFAAATLAAVFAIAGCRSMPERGPSERAAPPVDAAKTTVPADDNLNATVWFQTSAERDQVYRQLYRAAEARLDAAIADPAWDAMPRHERPDDPRALRKLAIIVDIDETVLDNAPYQARRVAAGDEYTDATWNAWVAQPLSGKPGAKALPGAVAFARAATARGVTVFYISNREAASAEATLKALNDAGFAASPAQFLGKGAETPGCTQTRASDKRCRRLSVARAHRVIMLFGDQLSDFLSETGDPAQRRRLAADYDDWFGQRWWMLPNPMYGAWEDATWSGQKPDRDGKRRAKRAALDPAE